MHPLLYMVLLGLALGTGAAILMFTLGGLRLDELRDRLIGSALHTYTHEGWTIPGVRRGPIASAVLWLLRYEGSDPPRLKTPFGMTVS